MATQKPLVIIGGQIQEIPVGDVLSAASNLVDVIGAVNVNVSPIVKGTPVYIPSAGNVDKASAAASGTKKVFGLVAETSIAAAASGYVQLDGVLQASTAQWDAVAGTTGGLVANTIYYLSATAGLLTATPPAVSGNFVVQVGLALNATDLEIDTDRGGVLLA